MELKNTEKQEHSVVALTIEITKAEFEAAKDKAFKKTGKNITVPGFRKGKAPRKMIEKLYGEGVFFEEAFNIIYPDAMEMAVEKSGIKPVGRADVDLGDPAEEGGLPHPRRAVLPPQGEGLLHRLSRKLSSASTRALRLRRRPLRFCRLTLRQS